MLHALYFTRVKELPRQDPVEKIFIIKQMLLFSISEYYNIKNNYACWCWDLKELVHGYAHVRALMQVHCL